jgi:hypothetical protein
VGARAIVAYERDDRYDLHRSQWGAQRLALRWRLTPETPFGGGDPPPVDPVASHTGVGAARIATVLDPVVQEAFYLVDSKFDVRAYLLARLGVEDQPDGGEPSVGVLAAPSSDDLDGSRLRSRIEGARSLARALTDDAHDNVNEWTGSGGTDPVASSPVRRALRGSIAEWATRTIQLRSIDDGTF